MGYSLFILGILSYIVKDGRTVNYILFYSQILLQTGNVCDSGHVHQMRHLMTAEFSVLLQYFEPPVTFLK